MATVDWPLDRAFTPREVRWSVDSPASDWAAVYTGARQSISHNADRLLLGFTLPTADGLADQMRREAFLMGLYSSGDTVRMAHPLRMAPQGAFSGSPVLTAAALTGARSVSVSGALAGVNLLRNAGFELDSNGDGLADTLAPYQVGTVAGLNFVRDVGRGSPWGQQVNVGTLGPTDGDSAGFRFPPVAVAGASVVTMSADLIGTANGTMAVLYIEDGVMATSNSIEFVAGTWTRLSVTHMVAPGSTAISPYFWLKRNLGGGSVFGRFDNVQLEVSPVATPYTGEPTLLPGDIIAVGNQLLPVGYAGATLTGGVGTVPLSVPVRKPLASGAAVLWNAPPGLWQVVSVMPELRYRRGLVQDGPDVLLREV